MAKPEGHGGIDYPDYIQATTPHSNPVQITLAELAIRLGFPQVFERTGNVLFYETFENGVSDWNPSGSPAQNKACLASRGLLNSPYSAKLGLDTTVSGFSTINKFLGYPYVTTFGFEMSFLADDQFGDLRVGLYVRTGVYRYSVWWSYSDVTYEWAVLTTGPVWQTVETYDIATYDHVSWHTVKIVADIPNEQYARLMFDTEDVGLSAIPLLRTDDTTKPYLALYIQNFIAGTRDVNIYVDNVILTINEPI